MPPLSITELGITADKTTTAEFEGNGCCCTPACCTVKLHQNPLCADGYCVYQTCCGLPYCDCCAPMCCGQGWCRCPCGACGENTFTTMCPPFQSFGTFEDKDTYYGQIPCLKCCACGAGFVRKNKTGAGPVPVEEMVR